MRPAMSVVHIKFVRRVKIAARPPYVKVSCWKTEMSDGKVTTVCASSSPVTAVRINERYGEKIIEHASSPTLPRRVQEGRSAIQYALPQTTQTRQMRTLSAQMSYFTRGISIGIRIHYFPTRSLTLNINIYSRAIDDLFCSSKKTDSSPPMNAWKA